MSNMDKDELERRLLVNEQSRSAENLDQLQTLSERYGWTHEEFIRERDRRFPTREEPMDDHLSPIPEKPTNVFEAYLHHLNLQDWGEEVVESIKNEVEETYLRMMVKSQLIKKVERAGYGLVVGRIQSGKTAHMLGLSFRAMDPSLHDVGEQYDTVIIMSGLLEDLRKQTLGRLQKTEIEDIIFLPKNGDFSSKNQQAKDELIDAFDRDAPLILVIKKNHLVLEALIEYLSEPELIFSINQRKILIIDDECDHASIDSTFSEIEKENSTSITATNRAVRKLILACSDSRPNCWYVGYTATPYSNLLMDPEPEYQSTEYGGSLFPRDLIYCLPPPDNHTDNEDFFGENSEKYLVPTESPEKGSAEERAHLRKLIHLHVLTKLIRHQINVNKGKGRVRKHSTMIHTDVETDYHLQIATICKELLDDDLTQSTDAVLFSKLDGHAISTYPEMYHLYEERKRKIMESEHLSLKKYYDEIIVVKLNSDKDDDQEQEYTFPQELNYSNQESFSHIVVGGQKLSRGLTIEDLVIVWFDRTAAVPNYDTLLQMARWCGYRNEFLSIIRLHMSVESIQNFTLIREVEIRLRTDLRKFTKDTNPLREIQWIREYNGMRISARASPNTITRTSNQTVLQCEFQIKHLPNQEEQSELKRAQHNLYTQVELLWDKFGDDAVASLFHEDFKIMKISWVEVRHFVETYASSLKSTTTSTRYLSKLLKECDVKPELSSEWTLAVFFPNSGKASDDEIFQLSTLGFRHENEIHLKIPDQAAIADFSPSQLKRQQPMLCLFIEDPALKQAGGLSVYEDNGVPIILPSFFLPEHHLSPTFIDFARPGAETSSEEE